MSKKKLFISLGLAACAIIAGPGPALNNVVETKKPIQVFEQVDFRTKVVSEFERKQLETFRDKSNIKIFTLSQMKNYGWGMDQYACLYRLWTKESNWRWNAHNKSSNAYGIAQATPGHKMRHKEYGGGEDWKTNPRTQITWGLSYIKRNHGSPCVAWQHSVKDNWY
jgi:hypothetical protein